MSEPSWELLGGGGVSGGPIDYIGNWSAGVTYQPGQVVRYNGIDYLAVNPSTGQIPPAAVSGIPPVVNGQWIKGVGGAMVWSSIGDGDLPARIGPNGSPLPGNDFNLATSSGFYYSNSSLHPPSGVSPYHAVLVVQAANNPAYVTQYAWDMYGGIGNEYKRHMSGSVWSAWTQTYPIPYATSLPASPFDGQEAILVDSVTAPTYTWHFRYNAGSSSTYKWEFIGGDDYWVTASIGVMSAISSGFNPYAPIFITPRAGDWDAWGGAQLSSGAGALTQISIGSSAPGPVANAVSAPVGGYITPNVSEVLTGVASGAQISHWLYAGSADVTSGNRWMRIRPRRVA